MPENASTIHVADWLTEEYAELRDDPEFIAQGLLIDLAVQIGEIMEEQGIEDQEALAEQVGLPLETVSAILQGDENFSIERLVRIALRLGKTVEINLGDHETSEVESIPTK